MESVYRRFESFDFDANTAFRCGLRAARVSGENRDELLKMKIFFYNRFVEPITLKGYQHWLFSQRSHGDTVLQPGDGCGQLVTDSQEGILGPGESGLIPGQQPAHAELEPRAPAAPLSFAEILRLIQAGEEIPGLEHPEVQPCHMPPTTSSMNRRPKPWEKSNPS
ncbi:hypothetical protein GN956_G15935 [Arapaima gigas]